MGTHTYLNLIPRHLYHTSLPCFQFFRVLHGTQKNRHQYKFYPSTLSGTIGSITDTTDTVGSITGYSTWNPGWSKNCWKANWLAKCFIKVKKKNQVRIARCQPKNVQQLEHNTCFQSVMVLVRSQSYHHNIVTGSIIKTKETVFEILVQHEFISLPYSVRASNPNACWLLSKQFRALLLKKLSHIPQS